MPSKITPSRIAGMIIVALAFLLTAWKGEANYLFLILVAIIFDLPGTRIFRKFINRFKE